MDAVTGVITTAAGNGLGEFSGDGGPATSAELSGPQGIALDAAGNLFITQANVAYNLVRRVDASTGIITTIAGVPGANGFSGDGVPATTARLNNPLGIAVDLAGNLFIADTDNHRIRRVDSATGIITTVAGNGTIGSAGDGGSATAAQLSFPADVALDSGSNLFITAPCGIRRVDAVTGIITTVAGNGTTCGFSGDGGPATSAELILPYSVTFDNLGNLFLVDVNDAPAPTSRVRRVDAVTGNITTVAGNGASWFSGDGGLATNAQMATPVDVAADGAGNIFIADNTTNSIRRVDALTGTITTVAGNQTSGFSGDGGLATTAQLNWPASVAVDGAGNVFITDYNNRRIRRVDGVTGIITTVAGNGLEGSSGDGGPATSAAVSGPGGIAVDGAGNLFIADLISRVRRVDAGTGIITTFAGNGIGGFSGDGGPATGAMLWAPTQLPLTDPVMFSSLTLATNVFDEWIALQESLRLLPGTDSVAVWAMASPPPALSSSQKTLHWTLEVISSSRNSTRRSSCGWTPLLESSRLLPGTGSVASRAMVSPPLPLR